MSVNDFLMMILIRSGMISGDQILKHPTSMLIIGLHQNISLASYAKELQMQMVMCIHLPLSSGESLQYMRLLNGDFQRAAGNYMRQIVNVLFVNLKKKQGYVNPIYGRLIILHH